MLRQHPGLDLEEDLPFLMEDALDPGGGHIPDGAFCVVAVHLFQVGQGNLVGVADIDVLSVVGLQGQGGEPQEPEKKKSELSVTIVK